MERQDSMMSEAEEKERIEIFISCRNLDDLDFITVTDSFLVVKLIENNQPEKVILKTKVYWNDLNPNYAETAILDFFFESKPASTQSSKNLSLKSSIMILLPSLSAGSRPALERYSALPSTDW